jgi:hypothetical protein
MRSKLVLAFGYQEFLPPFAVSAARDEETCFRTRIGYDQPRKYSPTTNRISASLDIR